MKSLRSLLQKIRNAVAPKSQGSEVNRDALKDYLQETERPPELLEELREFGVIMIDELHERRALIDTKAIGTLGFALAGFALLVDWFPKWVKTPHPEISIAVVYCAWGFALIAFASSIGSIILAFFAQSARGWTWPSENDWIRVSSLDYPYNLKCTHILALLDNYRTYNRANAIKAKWLVWAQVLLGSTGLCLGLLRMVDLL